jgi:hypothetical protein
MWSLITLSISWFDPENPGEGGIAQTFAKIPVCGGAGGGRGGKVDEGLFGIFSRGYTILSFIAFLLTSFFRKFACRGSGAFLSIGRWRVWKLNYPQGYHLPFEFFGKMTFLKSIFVPSWNCIKWIKKFSRIFWPIFCPKCVLNTY